MANTGPPFYATDAAEAARTQDHLVQPARRRAYRAQLQARMVGNPGRAQQLLFGFMPLKRHGGEL